MFVCASLAKSLWCKLFPHITLFEPIAGFQWLITRHYGTFTPLTETTHTLLYWFAIECRRIHLSVFRPPEVTMSWGNGVCTMTDEEWPGKSLSSFEAEIHLWNTVFVYHSVLLKVTREVCLPYPPSLHILSITVLQWTQEASTYLYLGLLFHQQRFAFWGVEESLTACSHSPPPPPHALFLWIGMSYSCPLLMGSYTVGETQRGQALRFLPQVSLYILPPPSALKKLVQEKCASGKVAPCCQWDFYPQGKPGW